MLHLDEIGRLDRSIVEEACRASSQSAYLGDHTMLCRLLTRYKFYLDTRDTGFASHVMLDGYWEIWLTQFIARLIEPGMVVADVGANYGYYTLLLAELVGPKGHVHAVEPNPAAAVMLRRSVDLNGFALRTSIVESCAASSDGQEFLLYVPHGEPKNACLIASADIVSPASGTIHQLRGRALDSIAAERGPLDFVKIDAEGAEEAIFDGMSHMLGARPPKIVLEFNVARYKEPLTFIKKLQRHYEKLRYVDYYGNTSAISPERLLSHDVGEDWLLYLAN